MITIFAWAIFIPSFAILLGVLWIMASEAAHGEWENYQRLDNWIHLAVLLVLTFVPGVYLFGW